MTPGEAPVDPPAIPNGAMMVKEMWTPPLARWAGTCWDCVKPDGSGAVFWIRDDQTFSTGWFGSWYGPGWAPAWPAAASNPLTGSGEGASQFCSNCHAATVSGNTFVSMRNYDGKNVHHFLTQLVPNIPAAIPADWAGWVNDWNILALLVARNFLGLSVIAGRDTVYYPPFLLPWHPH